nr:disease resistance protein RGA2-like [Ziziphus jujuba var. spinosa]
MAESILFGITNRIVESLTSAPVQEIALIWGAKDELSGLEETISTIKDVLLDAEEQQVHNHQVRSWLNKLEDAVYDTDDLSDDISTEVLRRQLMSGCNIGKKRIIKSVTDQSLGNLEMDQLQKELQKQINGKRYFLVLDDVWNENRELWISLQNLLSNGAKGSRILITTRSKVAGEITSTVEPYMLGLLDKDNSWSLFKKVAFKSGQEPNNSNTVKTAMEIVEKCGGIPLAIRTIGSMLYSKNPETEWSNFLEMEFSRIPQNENDILPTLKLSYDSLPSHLKNCFAYCRLFPKDHAIEVDMLIKLWMAQGFITSSNSIQSLEDVGNEYFKDLHWRSFFQEVEENLSTKRSECKMHDLMHDLAIQVAGTECATLHSTEENINERTRHVSFDFHVETSGKIPTSLSQKSKIRTTLFPQKSWESNKLSWDDILLNFKLLRTLDLHDSELKMVPKSIGKLKHLRYLDLSENGDIKRLPNSITKLQNLQTLKLSYCGDLVELPRDLKKLVNLRHLENHGCDSLTHMPSGLGQLTYLHTLNEFVVKKGIDSTGKQHNRHLKGKLYMIPLLVYATLFVIFCLPIKARFLDGLVGVYGTTGMPYCMEIALNQFLP